MFTFPQRKFIGQLGKKGSNSKTTCYNTDSNQTLAIRKREIKTALPRETAIYIDLVRLFSWLLIASNINRPGRCSCETEYISGFWRRAMRSSNLCNVSRGPPKQLILVSRHDWTGSWAPESRSHVAASLECWKAFECVPRC